MGGNNEFFENFERNKYLKKLPSMQRVNAPAARTTACRQPAFLSAAIASKKNT